jgi:hypothetical protein
MTITVDDLNALIAQGYIHVDLSSHILAEPDRCPGR